MGYDMNTVESSGDEDADYFRANIWGMGILRSAMKSVEILDLDHDRPEWPNIEKLSNESDDEYYARCDKAHSPILSFRSDNTDLVPIGKFCSNDGWVVVPEECEIIANGLDKVKEFVYSSMFRNPEIIAENSEDMQYVKDFATYCRHAAKHGGIKVW